MSFCIAIAYASTFESDSAGARTEGCDSQITQTLRFMIARQVAHSSIARIHDALVGVMPSPLSYGSISNAIHFLSFGSSCYEH